MVVFRSLDTRVLYFVVSHGGVFSFVMKAIIYEERESERERDSIIVFVGQI